MKKRAFLVCACTLLICACGPSIPKDALQLSPESLQNRQLQTRRFETSNNSTMLSAAAAVLQDLGFTMDESEFTLGILVASKRRDATSAGQIVGSILVALLGGGSQPVDRDQLIRVSMVMREIAPSSDPQSSGQPPQSSGQSTVRVTFQRIVTNTANRVTRAEQINDPDLYKEFFEKLSQSVFLEAHEI